MQPNVMYDANIRMGWGMQWERNPRVQVWRIIQKITFLQTVALLNYRPESQCHVTLSTFCKLVNPGVNSLSADQIGSLETSLVSVFYDFYVSRHS